MSLPPNLADHIRSYLSSPDVDLQTVSAKQIRKQLASIFPDLDIKAFRTEIDEISIPIFHEIKEKVEAEAKARAQNHLPSTVPTTTTSSSLPPLALPSRGIPGVVQLNSTSQTPVNHPTQSPKPSQKASQSAQRVAKQSSNKSKKRKSAAYVNSDDDDDVDAGTNGTSSRTKKRKTPRKPRAEGDGVRSNTGIHKELNCSAPLAELLGVASCSRPQVVKKLWEHIKANDLQNPTDKRQIICDEAMRKIFNINVVDMFTMNKLLAKHLFKEEEVIQQ
ncbi:hypothetical protein O181_024823 [Austropuccinia psidii MF-1]|uniref:DM2 domain-containing protein n=1 Tax=Austropuccinia psidii MF-1 TaxID=1389203 RepID=A0A9Q3GYJ3_9BASI|nr:hypothetical protein [Austropuccinia psidii MF-1]